MAVSKFRNDRNGHEKNPVFGRSEKTELTTKYRILPISKADKNHVWVTPFCTNNSYSLYGNTLHYWLSYCEDYRHCEGILSLLSQAFELYMKVSLAIFGRHLRFLKLTLIINDNLSPIYRFLYSIHLLSFNVYFVYV